MRKITFRFFQARKRWRDVAFHIRVTSPHAVASMAAKNKHRKKSKATNKVTFQPEEKDMEAENSGGEEDEDSAAEEGEGTTKKEEEFSLDEVLRLGGTQVSL